MYFLFLASLVSADIPSDYPAVPIRGVKGQVRMPLIGIGTWQYTDDIAAASVSQAFSIGYRHVDTSLDYKNQVGIGKALQDTKLARSDYFITTKVMGNLNFSATTEALYTCLDELQTDYIDLMLLHWPASTADLRKQQWMALEAFASAGRSRAIGISHYCRTHVQEVLTYSTLPIAITQEQYHVGMGQDTQTRLHDKQFMEAHGIRYESYSTLCGPCPFPDNTTLLTGQLVSDIGKKYNKTGAQVSLRWVVQQNIPVIPKSSSMEHLRENFELFDFSLSTEDMKALNLTTSPAETGTPEAPDDAQDCSFESY